MPDANKPQLLPVAVPWQISPSAAGLRALLSEDQRSAPASAEFAGFFKFNEPARQPQAHTYNGLPAFQPDDGSGKAPYHLIRVVFDRCFAARFSPSESESGVIRADDYDWSAVSARLLPGEKAHESLERTNRSWRETGICPNPGMYEVGSSPWLAILGSAAQARYKHYLLLGNEAYLDVIAQRWQWQLGQTLPGW